MKTAILILAMTMAAAARPARAEIIDRIAVSVGYQVITVSDLEREIRVTAFLNRSNPDFSPAGRRKTANRMVEQRLVRRELELSRYPVPDRSEAIPILQKFKQENYPQPGEYEKALSAAHLTDAEVRDEILWQLTLVRFIDVRFRPAVHVPDEEVKEYYEKNVLPAAKLTTPGQVPSIDDYRDSIEETLTQHKVDEELNTWMQEARKRTGVEFRDEVFQ